MRTVLRLSGSGTIQILIGTASYVGLVRILSVFGSSALAGYTIGIRVIIFALLPAFGISNAAATMVGQNLGAGRPDRAEHAVWTAARYNMLFLGAVGVIFLLAASPIVALFTDDPQVRPYAIGCLRIVSLGFVFYAAGMVLTQSFNGAGDTWTPTIINLFVFWLWEIPLAWWLSVGIGLGPRGVFIALTLAYSTLAVVSAVIFRRGKWKEKRI
jgi:Na+-driven multidrug efflux pump